MSQPTSTMEGGVCLGAPDVCVVPGAGPMPFVNIAQCAEADVETTTRVVRIRNKPVVRLATVIARSTGDEPGVGGGVLSGTVMGPAELVFSDTHVLFEGSPSVTLGCLSHHNNRNGLGNQISPSQTTVVIEPR